MLIHRIFWAYVRKICILYFFSLFLHILYVLERLLRSPISFAIFKLSTLAFFFFNINAYIKKGQAQMVAEVDKIFLLYMCVLVTLLLLLLLLLSHFSRVWLCATP